MKKNNSQLVINDQSAYFKETVSYIESNIMTKPILNKNRFILFSFGTFKVRQKSGNIKATTNNVNVTLKCCCKCCIL
jgi:nucleoid DNA-binding protein